MKSTVLPHVCWALVAPTAFAIGSLMGEKPVVEPPASSETTRITDRDQAASNSRAGALDSPAPEHPHSLTPEQARILTFEVLRETNHIQRTRRLLDLLARVTPGNWMEILEGFERQKTFEGREFLQEATFALERIGEVAGRDALELALNSERLIIPNAPQNLMNGWAGADPDAAFDWFRQQTPQLQKKLKHSLIAGLTRSDPDRALQLHGNDGFQLFSDSAFAVAKGAIQIGGFSEAERLLRAARYRPDLQDRFKQQMFDAVSKAKRTMSERQGDPFDSLQWLENYLGKDSPATGNAVQQIVRSAAATDPLAALEWLERRAHLLNETQAKSAFPTALTALAEKDPERFTKWIADHPDHPQHDRIIERYALDLRHKGKLEEARQWSPTIRDEKIRARVENSLRAAENARAKNRSKAPF